MDIKAKLLRLIELDLSDEVHRVIIYNILVLLSSSGRLSPDDVTNLFDIYHNSRLNSESNSEFALNIIRLIQRLDKQ